MMLSPEERRRRIYELAGSDPELSQLLEAHNPAKKQFEEYTNQQTEELRELLWRYPGNLYFLHHRMLTFLCERMKFLDEE